VGEKTVINGTTYYISYYYDENGAPMGINVNGSAYFFVKNLQGDITAIMSYTGTVVAKYTYDAWGKLLSVRDGNNQAVTSPTHIANLNPFRYRCYIYDTETGLYYLNSRYYDAEVGRFISPDSADVVTITEGIYDKNLYAYCDNNPVMRVDTAGYFWDIFFDVVSLVASVVEVVANPTDGGAWLGLAGDVVDLVPFVTGVGETVKAVRTVDKVADAVDTAHDVGKAVDNANDVGKALDNAGDATNTVKKTVSNAERSSAVRKAWKNELFDVKNGGRGISRDWTDAEIDELLHTGKVRGYQGHHMQSVKGYPELAGDPNNIQFLTRQEHLRAHLGNFRNITHGRYIP
jgi:RHS repeat-associated protein